MNRLTASRALLVVSFFCVGGCSGKGGSTPSPVQSDAGAMSCGDAGVGTSFPCDVAPIIEAKCQRCHDSTPALMACVAASSCVAGPFPLTTWSDTRRHLGPSARVVDLLAEVIETDVMPYQTDSISPPVEKLTPAEKATLLTWARSCAPASATVCAK